MKKTLKEIIAAVTPPPKWKLPVLISLGVFFGLGLAILRISNATSYLSDNPQTCMNCHVMTPQYATWQRSSHARVATCNDCHVPHGNFVRTYLFKAKDGLRHAAIFTLRLEPEVIHIKEAGISVVQENCIRCHSNLVHRVSLRKVTGDDGINGTDKLCWECHRETPHGRVNSLSSFPMARIPKLTPVMPDWIEKFLESKKRK